MFTDPLALDLTLQEQSPCTDAGTALYISNGDTLTNIQDYSGSAPDIGAYEYGQSVYIDPPESPAHRLAAWFTEGNSPGEKVIVCRIPCTCPVGVTMFDIRGRMILQVPPAVINAGRHEFSLNTAMFPPGIYLVRIHAGDETASVKVPVRTR